MSLLGSLAVVGLAALSARTAATAPVRADATGHHMVDAAGRPFFWLGDTAWMLFQGPTREEIALYLDTRAAQGFTVIQAALVMGERRVAGHDRPNPYGDRPFVGDDAGQPAVTPGNDPAAAEQYDYWDHVDFAVAAARARGLTMALLPLFVAGGDGFRVLTPANAEGYGRFLGRRYGREPNVVWVLGGDSTPETALRRQVWDRMAEGLTKGVAGAADYGRTFITYHINIVGSSAEWFHEARWLDANMLQTWDRYVDIYKRISFDYHRHPAKPAGLGEGAYEDGPQYPTRPIDALAVRKQAYWSYFAGGYHTYGNTNLWNFGSYRKEATQDWKAALASPGARSLTVLRRFFDSIPWWRLVPDRTLFADGIGRDERLNVAMRSRDGDLVVAYLGRGAKVTLDLSSLSDGRALAAAWIDPRSGARTEIGTLARAATGRFETPAGWDDALLVVATRTQLAGR